MAQEGKSCKSNFIRNFECTSIVYFNFIHAAFPEVVIDITTFMQVLHERMIMND